MGGQACVFYGAAEFSRDIDFALLCNEFNLRQLRAALDELQAKNIAVPPFEADYLERGFAVHFRCFHADCWQLRLDVMATMRGVAPFEELWNRRTVIALEDNTLCHLMGIADLVKAKKTQRDKDWPMIARLMEAHYTNFMDNPTAAQIEFWLREARTPSILHQLAKDHAETRQNLLAQRPLLALWDDLSALEVALREEEWREREADKIYWAPLKRELEALRRALQR